MENLISEIMSFVDAINPEVCAWEWMIKSGATSPARYLQAVADMEDIRTKAWLLACDLSKATGKSPFTHHWLNWPERKASVASGPAVFPSAAFLRGTGCFIGYQVRSTKHKFRLVLQFHKRQRPFGMTDIGIDSTPVNTQITCGFTDGVYPTGKNFQKQLV